MSCSDTHVAVSPVAGMFFGMLAWTYSPIPGIPFQLGDLDRYLTGFNLLSMLVLMVNSVYNQVFDYLTVLQEPEPKPDPNPNWIGL